MIEFGPENQASAGLYRKHTEATTVPDTQPEAAFLTIVPYRDNIYIAIIHVVFVKRRR